jgi:hypothetical protein
MNSYAIVSNSFLSSDSWSSQTQLCIVGMKLDTYRLNVTLQQLTSTSAASSLPRAPYVFSLV